MEPLLEIDLAKKLLSTKEAAKISGYNPDYLARLCRDGKILGTQVGRTWLVSQKSLEDFVKSQELHKQELHGKLSETRGKEYHHAQTPVVRTRRKLSPVFETIDPYKFNVSSSLTSVRKLTALQRHGIAVLATLTILLIGVSASQLPSVRALAEKSLDTSLAISDGVRAITDDALAHATAVGAQEIASANIPSSPFLSENSPANSSGVSALAISLPPLSSQIVRTVSAQTFSTSTKSVIDANTTQAEFIPDNARHADLATLGHSLRTLTPRHVYAELGALAYTGIENTLTGYTQTIQASGDGALALGTSIRDTGAALPRQLALGEIHAAQAWVALSQNILHTYSRGVFAWVDETPKVPAVLTQDAYDTGSILADMAAATPHAVVAAYQKGMDAWVTGTPEITNNIAQTELALATNAADIAGVAIDSGLTAEQNAVAAGADLAYATYEQEASLMDSLPNDTINRIATFRASANDTLLGTLGNASLVANALPGYSFGEQAALATYNALHGFFANPGGTLAELFGFGPKIASAPAPQLLPLPPTQIYHPFTPPAVATAPTTNAPTRSITVINNNGNSSSPITRITQLIGAQGVTQQYVDAAVQALRDSLSRVAISQIDRGTSPISQTLDLIQRYDTIAIKGSSFTNGTIANTNITGGTITTNSLSVTGPSVLPTLFASSTYVTNATTTNATTTNAFATNFTNTNGVISNLLVTNGTTTNATSTNFFGTNASITNLLAINGTTTNSTSSNLFATNFTNTNGTIANLTSTNGTITNFLGTSGTTTNATSTNLFATNIVGTNANLTNLSVSATTTTAGLSVGTLSGFLKATAGAISTSLINLAADVSGILPVPNGGTGTSSFATNGVLYGNGTNNLLTTTQGGANSVLVANGGTPSFSSAINVGTSITTPTLIATNASTTNLTAAGFINAGSLSVGNSLSVQGISISIGNATSTTVLNGNIGSNIIPSINKTYDLGSPSFYWSHGYIDNLNVNNLSAASTSIGGTVNQSFTINSANATADAQDMQLIFFRGTVNPNAVLAWNHTAARFEVNQPTLFWNQSSTTTIPSLMARASAGQTADIFQLQNSAGNVLSTFNASGALGIGSSSPWAQLSVNPNGISGPAFAIGSSTGTSFMIGNDGLVSIGTSTTSLLGANLNVVGNGTSGKIITLSSVPSAITSNQLFNSALDNIEMLLGGRSDVGTYFGLPRAGLGVFGGTPQTGLAIGTRNATPVIFASNNAERGRFDSSGNFGIGTSTPYMPLSVGYTIDDTPAVDIADTFYITPEKAAGAHRKFYLSTNIHPDPVSNWVTDDTTLGGWVVQVQGENSDSVSAIKFRYRNVGAAGNTSPATVDVFSNTGGLSIGSGFTGTNAPTGGAIIQGSVGIGTTSPSQALSVQGSVLADSFIGTSTILTANTAVSLVPLQINIPSNNGGLQISRTGTSAGNLSLKVGTNGTAELAADNNIDLAPGNVGNTLLAVSSGAVANTLVLKTGNVGIGTTTPATALTVAGLIRSSTNFADVELVANNGSGFRWALDGSNNLLLQQTTNTFGTVSTPFTVLTGGNVGIGTVTPSNFKLQVAGNIGPDANATYDLGSAANFFANAYVNNLRLGTNSNFATMNLGSIGAVGAGNKAITSNYGFVINPAFIARADSATLGVGSGAWDGVSTGFFNGSAAGTIVGVNATSTFTGNLADFQINGSSKFLVGSNGNVGVGTTTPYRAFAVNGDSVFKAGNINFDNATGTQLNFNTATKTIQLIVNSTNDFSVNDSTTGTTWLYDRAGNLGIGNYFANSNLPQNKLSVNGSASIGFATNADVAGPSNGLLVNGNVGIGTSSAAVRLNVSKTNTGYTWSPNFRTTAIFEGDNSVSGGTTVSLVSPTTGFSEFAFGTPSTQYQGRLRYDNNTDALSLWTNTNQQVTITSAGNVGIGTTTPSHRLDLAVGNADGIRIENTTQGLSTFLTTNSGALTSLNASGQSFQLLTGAANLALYATSAGNIGIGTSTPAYKLDVNGNVRLNTGSFLYLNDQANVSLSADTNSLYTNANSVQYRQINGTYKEVLNANGLTINNGVTGAVSGVGLAVATGSVGIGTTSPYAQLSIHAANGSTNTTLFAIGSSTAAATTTLASIDNQGQFTIGNVNVTSALVPNVGIYQGAANQLNLSVGGSSKLAIGAGSATWGVLQNDSNGTGYQLAHAASATTTPTLIPNRGSTNTGIGGDIGGLSFITAGSASAVINSAGNFGIGTTTPLDKLTVEGSDQTTARISLSNSNTGAGGHIFSLIAGQRSIGQTGFSIYDATANGTRLSIDNNGNIGVGTTSPQSTLDVNGTLTFSSSNATAQVNVQGAGNTSSFLQFDFPQLTNAQASVRLFRGTNTSGNRLFTIFKGDGTASTQTQFNAFGDSYINALTGNVGIGTTSPAVALDVYGTSRARFLSAYDPNPLIDLQVSSGGTVDQRYFRQTIAGTTWILDARNDAAVQQRVLIAAVHNTGNVGIGTTTPATKLDVNGVGRFEGTGGFSIGNDANQFRIDTQGPTGQEFRFLNAGNGYAGINAATAAFGSYAGTAAPSAGLIASGNVGFGTSSPATALDVGVAGGMLRVGGSAGNNLIQAYTNNGANGLGLWAGGITRLYSTGNLTLSTNATLGLSQPTGTLDVMTLTSGGNVGIGTTTPASPLEVVASGGFTPSAQTVATFVRNVSSVTDAVVSINSGTAGKAILRFGNSSLEALGLIKYDNALNSFGFGTNGVNDYLTIGSTGNVGIGTTSPQQKLEVNGNIAIPGSSSYTFSTDPNSGFTNCGIGTVCFTVAGSTGLYINGSGFRFPSGRLFADSGTGNSFIQFNNTNGAANSNTNYFSITNGATGVQPIFGAAGADTNINLTFAPKGTGNSVFSTGSVGIGSTTPYGKLAVDAGGGTEGISLGNFSSGGPDKIIDALVPNATVSGFYVTNTGTFSNSFGLASNVGYIGSTNATPVQLQTNGVARVYADTVGNVGIGTTSPWAQLSVNPNGISGPAFAIGSSTSTSFVVSNAGFVGIGTANPAFALDVSGNSIFRNSLFTNQVSSTAGNNLSLYANNNTNLGITIQTGTGNVGIGTTTPLYKLSIQGPGLAYLGTDGSTLTATSSGTTRYELSVNGTTSYGLSVGGNNVDGGVLRLGIGGTAASSFISGGRQGNAEYDVFVGNTTPAMTILSGGQVGIGTTTPSSPLDVAGDIISETGNLIKDKLTTGAGSSGRLVLARFSNGALAGSLEGTNNPRSGDGLTLSYGGGTGEAISLDGTNGYIGFYTNSNNTERARIDSSGNFGIGTTSPTQALSVQGNALISGTITSSSITATSSFIAAAGSAPLPSYTFTGDTTTGLYDFSVGTLGFTTAGQQRATLNSSGLAVNGSAAFGGTAIAAGTVVQVASNATDPTTGIFGGNFQRTLVLTSSNAQTATGGSFNVSLSANAFNDTGTIDGGQFQVQNANTAVVSNTRAGDFLVYNTGTGTITNAYASYNAIQNLQSTGFITNAYGSYVGAGFNNGTINNLYGVYVDTLPTASTTYGFYENSTANNYFKGNVGIGTTSPAAQLSVQGSGTGPYLYIATTTGSIAPSLLVDNTGVGIGVSAAAAALDVGINKLSSGSAQPAFILRNSNPTTGSSYTFSFGGSAISAANGKGLQVQGASGASYVSFLDSVSNPAVQLQLSANTGTGHSVLIQGLAGQTPDLFTISSSTAATLFNVTNVGNVGIGTTSPSQALSVQGNALISGTETVGQIIPTNNSIPAYGFYGNGTSGSTGSMGFAINSNNQLVITNGSVAIGSGANQLNGSSLTAGQTGGGTNSETLFNQSNSNTAAIALYFANGSSNTDASILLNSSANTSGNGARSLTINANGGPLALQTAGVNALYINSSQQVGIGTSTPDKQLVVGTNTSPGTISIDSGSGASDTSSLLFRNTSSGVVVGSITSSWTNAGMTFTSPRDLTGQSGFHFKSNAGTERLTIDTGNGNVGIGTSSPSTQLVLGNSTGRSLTFSTGLTSWPTLLEESIFTTEAGGASYPFLTAGNLVLASRNNSGQPRDVILATYASGSLTPALIAQGATGYVGIGTTTPTNPLTLPSGTVAIPALSFGDTATGFYRSAANEISYSANNSQKIIFQSNGNVVFGGSVTFGNNQSRAGQWSGGNNIILQSNGGTAGLLLDTRVTGIMFNGTTSAFPMIASSSTQNALVIQDANGTFNTRLGVGTSTPGSELSVGTTGGLSVGADYTAAAPTNGAIIEGSVGIGTTSPQARLHVVGPTLVNNGETTYPLWLSDVGNSRKALVLGYDLTNDVGVINAVNEATGWKNIALQTNGGNLLIGTTTSRGLLTLASAASVGQNTLTIDSTGLATTDNLIRFTDANANQAWVGLAATNSVITGAARDDLALRSEGHNILFSTISGGGSIQAILTPGGNFGIGTTTPGTFSNRLFVNGSIGIPNNTTIVGVNNAGTATREIARVDASDQVQLGGSLITMTSSGVAQMLLTGNPTIQNQSNGTVTFQGYNGSGQQSELTMSPTATVFNNGANSVDFTVKASGAPSALFVQGSTGNVGIGSTSPNGQLVVNTSQTAALRLSSITAGRGIFADNGASAGIFSLTRQDTVATGDLSIAAFGGVGFTGGSTSYNNAVASGYQAYLSSAGNFGIGTTTPTTLLDVNSSASTGTGGLVAYFSNSTATNGGLRLNVGSDAALSLIAQGVNVTSNLQPLQYNNTFTGTTDHAGRGGSMFALGGGGLSYQNFPAGTGQTSAIRFLIDPNGNVGVGSTSPYAQLSIFAGGNYAAQAASTLFAIGSTTAGTATSTLFTVSSNGNAYHSGNVGIGTTSPTSALDVVGDIVSETGSQVKVKLTTGAGSSGRLSLARFSNAALAGSLEGANNPRTADGLTLAYTGGTGEAISLDGANGFIGFYTNSNNTERARIDSSGNLGIGTTSPYANLSVHAAAGSTNTTLFAIGSSTASATTTLFTVSNTGNAYHSGSLGIGVVSPAFKLDVAGPINTDKYSGFYQNGSLLAYASSTNTATVFGLQAGGNDATTTASAHHTSAFGYQALNAVAGSDENSAFGYQALSKNVSGSYNTAVGSQALQVDTASFNTALGSQALSTITSGGQNTGLGYSAGSAMTTGTDNVAIGSSVLSTGSAGGGNFNVALGSHALGTRINGNNNVAIGYNTLGGGGTGNSSDDNVGIGNQALFNNTGAKNIAIGRQTSYNQTSGNNNITLGALVEQPNLSGSQQLNIANVLYGTNLYSGGSPSSVPVINGNIGIGSSSPYAQLSVHAVNNSTNSTIFAVASSTSNSTTTLFTVLNTGNVGLASTSPWRTLDVNGTVGFKGLTAEGSSGSALCLSASNEVQINSGVQTCTVSSQRYKHGIESTNTGLAAVLAMNPVTFYYNADTQNTNQQYGFIAEQVQQIDPKLVDLNSDGQVQSVRYEEYTAVLTKAIQQLATGYSLGNVGSASSTVSSSYAGVAAAAINVDASGNVGIGNSAPSDKLTVAGNVSANGFTENGVGLSYSNMFSSLVFGSTTASVALSPDGKNVDVYKMASFALTGVQQLANQINGLSSVTNGLAAQTSALASTTNALNGQVQTLDARIAALEAGATAGMQSATSSAPSLLSATSTQLASALESFGVLLQNGIAQFNTLVVRNLVFSKDSNGASAAGSGAIAAGSTTVLITNPNMLATSQVSITLTSPLVGNWYVSNKQNGSFQVTLSAAQTGDVTFDYIIVQTQGQIATTTPTGYAGSPFHWLSSLFGGSTTPSAGGTVSAGVGSGSTTTGSTSGSGTASSTAPSANAPTVTLNGSAAISLTQNDLFTDPGATAKDASGTDISSSIKVTGTVDTSKAGMYTLTYTATDAAGNTGSASRVVTVAAGASSSAPSPAPASSTPTPAPSDPSPTPAPAPAASTP